MWKLHTKRFKMFTQCLHTMYYIWCNSSPKKCPIGLCRASGAYWEQWFWFWSHWRRRHDDAKIFRFLCPPFFEAEAAAIILKPLLPHSVLGGYSVRSSKEPLFWLLRGHEAMTTKVWSVLLNKWVSFSHCLRIGGRSSSVVVPSLNSIKNQSIW